MWSKYQIYNIRLFTRASLLISIKDYHIFKKIITESDLSRQLKKAKGLQYRAKVVGGKKGVGYI